MNLTSSDDEARVFKSEELQASLVATLDALAAAIAQKKAEIVSRSMHPEAAFTLRSALEDTVAVVAESPSAAKGTQEATGEGDGTITPMKKNKRGSEELRRSTRNVTLNAQQAQLLKGAKVALLVQHKRKTRSGDRKQLQEKIVTVTRPEHGNAAFGEPVNM
jgi:hypothetical protein